MGDRNRSDLLGRRDDSAELPYPWEKHFDDEYQSYYYFNPETQETQWAAVDEQAPFVPNEAHYEASHSYDRGDPYEFGDAYSLDELDGDASISNMSRLSQLSVVERSEHMMAVKREKQEALRQQLLQREEEELRAPEINKRSKQLNRNVDDIFAWEEQRKARMEALAAQQRAAEAAQNTGRPTLYASSSASVSSHTSSDSAVQLPVEARLMAYEEKRKLKLQQTIAHEKNEARRSAIPTIAPHSSNLVQRRVAAQARGEEVPQLSNRRIAAGETPGILRDSATGQTYFQPKLNRKSEQIAAQSRPQIPIEDLLTDKGRLQQQKQAERERRLDQRAQEMRQVSKVNPRSELLVQERYILQGETTQDRLARPIGQVKQKTLEEIEKPTFKPTLNPVSIEMTMNNGYNVYGVDPRSHNNNNNNNHNGNEGPYSPQEEALARFNSMYNDQYGAEYGRDEYGNGEYGEPLLYEDLLRGSKHSHNSNNNNNNNYANNSSNQSYLYDGSQSLAPQDAMYSKTQRWNEMRNQKLEKERKERERKEAEICTFKPKIESSARISRGNSSHNNSFSYNNNTSNNNNSYLEEEGEGGPSIDAYLERQLTWVEKRDQKLEQERRKAAEKELADCSFAPRLLANPNIAPSGPSLAARLASGAVGGNGGNSSVKPTNTTFGSNIYTNNSNAPAGVQNVRRGGAGVAKVAYNANRGRQGQGVSNYADEGPFYASEETPSIPHTKNKYYNNNNSAYYEDEQEDQPLSDREDDPAPPPPAHPGNTHAIRAPVVVAEHSGGRIPLPLPGKVPITRQTSQTQPPYQPQYQPQAQQQQRQHQHHAQPEEQEEFVAPVRVKVPLPNKALAPAVVPTTSSRKNVHFSGHADDEDRNFAEHAEETYTEYDEYGEYGGGYDPHHPHEVTVDYSDSPGSDYRDEEERAEGDEEEEYARESPGERYNGLPFQVTSSCGGGSRSPSSPSSAALSHQLFPPTPHQTQNSYGQRSGGPVSIRPAPYASSAQPARSAVGGPAPKNTNGYTFNSFVEPSDEPEYGLLPSPSTVSSESPYPSHGQRGAPSVQGRPQRPSAPPVHLAQKIQQQQQSQRRAIYEDPDASPPPPPPMVFQEQPRASSNAPVVITGRSHSSGTPYGAPSRALDQLRSPDEDYYPQDNEY